MSHFIWTTSTKPENQKPMKTNLVGIKFTSPRYDCIWTVLYYHRGGNWVCQEPRFNTTCHFHESEIQAGIRPTE